MIEEPPPVGYTRRRRHRPPPPPQQQIARRDEPIYTFFSTLFDRPVRRRYLHSINQNATNLVRRLSQSRLFINRSNSRHSPEVNTPTTPMGMNVDERITIDRSGATAPFDSTQNLDGDDDVYEQIMVRTETPPPPYVDVAAKKRLSL